MVPVRRNLVDLVWEERPSQPAEPVFPHPLSLCGQWQKWFVFSHYLTLLFPNTGQSWQEKVASIREKMKEEGVMALVVTALDEIACEW